MGKLETLMVQMIIGIILLTFLIYFLQVWRGKESSSNTKHPVSFENAKATLDRIYNWVTWMMGIQTVVIGAIGFLLKGNRIVALQVGGMIAILFFSVSILLATTIFSSLASIQQRLTVTSNVDGKTENDVFLMEIYKDGYFEMGKILTIVHVYFIVGLIAFGFIVFKLYTS
jgi:hypothetical protein